MSDTTKSEPFLPFESASELRKEHTALLETLDRCLDQDPSTQSEAMALARLKPDIQRFLKRGAATGINLEDIKDRTACQVMLDYWVSSLSRAGIQVSGVRLNLFDSDKLPVLDEDACPYVGLESFRDQTKFFGREESTRELVAKILEVPLVVVIGASGCGKSSIVIAGVLPALRAPGAISKLQLIPPFVPGNAVLDNLVNAIQVVYPGGSLSIAAEAALLRQDSQHLLTMIGGLNAQPTLITIDQFEEVFTLSDSSEREALVENLAQLLNVGQGHRVVLTVRTEFGSRISELRPLSHYLGKAVFLMPSMSYEELKSAVEKPAALVNLQFQPGIQDDLVQKVFRQPAALPLLQFNLRLLWEKRNRNRITWEVYNAVGDPIKALERFADDFYLNQIAQTREEVERILRELVRVDELLEAYRQPVPKSRLLRAGRANTQEVLDLLIKHDFVRVTPGATGADDMVEIKHEALMRNWPRFGGWIEEKRRQRRGRLALIKAAKQWAGSRKPEDLFTGWQLQEAKGQSDISAQEKAFIEASDQAVHLKQKEKEAALRWRMLAWFFGMLAAFLICGMLLYRYLFVWEYSTYYNEYTRVHGIPVGVGKELKAYQYKARATSLRMIKKGRWGDDERDLLRMEVVNGSGILTPENGVGTYFDRDPEPTPSHECRWEYIRDSRGRIIYEKAYNKFGSVVWVLIYSPPSSEGLTIGRGEYVWKLYRNGDSGLRDLFKAFIHGKPPEYPQTRDALYLREEPLGQSSDKPFGIVIPEDSRKAVPGSELRASGQNDKREGTREVGRDLIAGTSDKATMIAFVFSEAKVVRIDYSSKGYEQRVRYFDGDHNPVIGPDKAYGVVRKFSKDGLEEEITSIDRYGKSMNDEAGNATLKIAHDEYGSIKIAEAFDSSRRPVLVNSGWYKFRAGYDSRGNRTEAAYFGLKGESVLQKGEYHKERVFYDDRGNRTEWAYFNRDGKPILLKDGFYKATGKYDDRGNRTEWAYFGIKGEPVLHKDGYQRAKVKHDVRGNQTEWEYFDRNGEPILLEGGFYKATGKYDDRGNRTEWEYFGIKGEPVLHKDGYQKAKVKCDDRGNRTEWEYFGIKGEPVLHKDGYQKAKVKYDDRGNKTEWEYFGIKGEPVLHKDGYQKETGKYDVRGNQTEWEYFGIKDEPVLHKDGYQKETGKYDVRGNQTEWAYFGIKDEPVLHKDGYQKAKVKYDDRGNQTEWAYFGIKDEPVLHKDGYQKAKVKYDDRGNKTEWEYFGIKDEPILLKDGYQKAKVKYDDRGNRTEWAYFGIKDEPVLHKDGYQKAKVKYDVRGNQTEWAYFGIKGEKILLMTACHKETAKYDDCGHEIERECYGIDEKPKMQAEGYFRLIKRFDARGQLLEASTYDEYETLTVNIRGYARMTRKYDERGNITEESYFGADEKPKLLNEGCARYVYKYLNDGTTTEKTCFGTTGKMNADKKAYVRVIQKFGAGKLLIEERFVASDGKPARVWGFGQHITKYAYDSLGNKTEELYLGVNEEPVMGISPDGKSCLRWTARYDSSNTLIGSKCHVN